MKIKDVTFNLLANKASSNAGLCVNIGPFVVRICTKEKSFLRTFALLYQDFQLSDNPIQLQPGQLEAFAERLDFRIVREISFHKRKK